MTSIKHRQAAMFTFEMAAAHVEFWAFFDTNSFRIAGALEAKTPVSGRPQCFYTDRRTEKIHTVAAFEGKI